MRPLPPSPPSEENSTDSQIPRDYGIPEADFNWPWYKKLQQEERKRLEDEEKDKDKDNALYRVTLCFAILCFLTLYLLAYVFLSH